MSHSVSQTNNLKTVQDRAILTMADHCKSYVIYRTAQFSMTLNAP